MSIIDKKKKFREVFNDFSDRQCFETFGGEPVDADDWLKLLLTVDFVMRQEDGLLWSDIKEIIEKEI